MYFDDDRDYEEAAGWEDASEGGGYYDEDDGWEGPEDSEGSEYEGSDEEVMQAEPSEAPFTQETEAEATAEKEIEGDFRRLVDNIKEGRAQGLGTSSSVWDVSIEEAEGFDIQEELRTATGIGKRRKRRHGPRDQPQLSQQVKALLGEGNAAYVSHNLPETIRIMEEVIRIEPRVPQAWATLALCYENTQPEKALKLQIIRAHLMHEVDIWIELGSKSRGLGYLQQALYCYRKACTLDPTDVKAQWDRASLAKEVGDYRTAKAAFLAILKLYPHDMVVLDELRAIFVELGEIPKGIELYQAAFEYYQEQYPTGTALDKDNIEVPGGGFGDIHIIVLADFYNSVNDPEKAVLTVRRGARWLQGRADQRFWDNEIDDREFDLDLPNMVRPGQDPSITVMRYPLDINFRHRLAISRLMLGDHEEGKIHSDIILQNDVREHAILFTELADAMFEQGLFDNALNIYEVLSADETTSSFRIVFQAAACHRNIGNLKEAAEIYQHIISGDPDNLDAKMKLAEVYESMGDPKKALNLVYEVIDARRRNATRDNASERAPSATAQQGESLFEEKTPSRPKSRKSKPGMTLAQLQALELEHEETTKKGFEKLRELAPLMKNGDKGAETAWLTEAENLIEGFRRVKPLFPSTRVEFKGMPAMRRTSRKAEKKPAEAEAEENDMASRLQLEIEYDKVASKSKRKPGEKTTEFRRISFDEWLLLFVEYAFALTKTEQYALADEVLRHAMQSVVFQEPEPADTLRIALMACAIRARDFDTVVAMSRKLINAHQFNNGPPRLLLASLASGILSVDSFIDSRLQKHLNREVKLSDAAAKGKELRWNPHNRRYNLAGSDVKEDADEQEEPKDPTVPVDIPDKPTKPNPVMVCLYGQLCVAARSYQSGIFYLLHAYEYQPNDPLICLSLAVAYLGRAMQRQADNRNFMIAESLTFLSQYRDIRSKDAENIDEVEFNFARTFHQIGLFHYAKKHYERVLSNTLERRKSDPNFVGLCREAAYNLSLIYMASGANRLAKSVYREWLSI